MPKLKTKKGIAKRFRLTKKKKLKYSKIGRGHLLSGKESDRKMSLRQPAYIESKAVKKTLKKMLPYS